MKIKNLSKLLAIGVLLNSIPINSFAGILSEDTRYETFEGNSIKIDDILEEDKVDVEIEGNTLVNLVFEDEIKENGTSIYYYNRNYNIGSGVYTVKNLSSKPISIGVFSADNPTNYLRSIVVDGNSSVTHVLNENECFIDTVGKFSDGWTTKDKKLLEKSILIFKGKVDDINTPRYFKGLKSTGELENNKIKIIAQEYNEFTDNTNGLICHFKPNSSSIEGNILKDLSGNNNNATLINVDSSNIGSNYIQFNGINSYATINRVIKDDFTIMIKAQVDTVSGTANNPANPNKNQWFNHAGIIDGEVSGITNDFGITITEDGYPAFGIGNPDKTYFHKKNCFGSIKTFVFSRNKNQGVVKVYVDGELIGEIEDTTKNSLMAPTKLSIAKANYFGLFTKMKLYELKIYNKSLEQNKIMKSNEKEIILKEPLRGIEGGVKDRIIKKNGQWVIERNCGQKILNGKENWIPWYSDIYGDNHSFRLNFNNISSRPDSVKSTFINNKLPHESFDDMWYGRAVLDKSISAGDPNAYTDRSSIFIRNIDFTANQLSQFKRWLSENPITLVYELANPYYEPLNVDLTLSLYKDTTYISHDSIIPTSMKITVDRVANRAKEYNELAKENPTIENIALARMWTNLMRESILKDEFQYSVDSITEIADMQLDRKSASANLDVYIKCENILQMTLDTNSITFEDFSGVEDIIKENAVNVTINSSLPYSLNAYLPTEIQNSDKSNTMDKYILNIKENSESNYQTFSNTIDKIILKDNCPSGNDLIHGVDIKLKGGIAHEKDIYKTTIKFEAEQK